MQTATILLAEDDPTVLRSVYRLLTQQKIFEVHTAVDGKDAWAKAQKLKPDLILSDYDMPGMTGFELCRLVKADRQLSSAMFVVLTGFSDTQLKVSGLNLGVDDYLTKPVEATELLAKLRATLRIKSLHDRLRTDNRELKSLHGELASSFDNLLSVLVHLIDLSVPGASSRGRWLAQKARLIAERMDVPTRLLEELELAATLHEIGRVVDHRNGEDGSAEPWQYLIRSRAVLEQIPRFEGVADLVATIGEHWDGTGTPEHLVRGQTPLRTRILRVLIDFYGHWDGAEGGSGVETALAEIERYGGTRYDPLVVSHLRSAVDVSAEDNWRPQKHRIPVSSLRDGMVLAEDLCTASGAKLLSGGATVTETELNIIRKRHSSDPILYGVWVWAAD